MKQKTHTGMKKRIKLTSNGKIRFKKAGRNHLLSGKSKRQKRSFRNGRPSDKSDEKKIRAMMKI